MNRQRAKIELMMVSSGTLANILKETNYEKLNNKFNKVLEYIDEHLHDSDFAMCKTWMDVWERIETDETKKKILSIHL